MFSLKNFVKKCSRLIGFINFKAICNINCIMRLSRIPENLFFLDAITKKLSFFIRGKKISKIGELDLSLEPDADDRIINRLL